MSVKETQLKIDSAEFTEWMAFHKRKPFSFDSVENILSIIAAMVANTLSKKGTRVMKPTDFIPSIKRRPKREDPKVMQAKLKSMFRIK